jgi:hypothetical protein
MLLGLRADARRTVRRPLAPGPGSAEGSQHRSSAEGSQRRTEGEQANPRASDRLASPADRATPALPTRECFALVEADCSLVEDATTFFQSIQTALRTGGEPRSAQCANQRREQANAREDGGRIHEGRNGLQTRREHPLVNLADHGPTSVGHALARRSTSTRSRRVGGLQRVCRRATSHRWTATLTSSTPKKVSVALRDWPFTMTSTPAVARKTSPTTNTTAAMVRCRDGALSTATHARLNS